MGQKLEQSRILKSDGQRRQRIPRSDRKDSGSSINSSSSNNSSSNNSSGIHSLRFQSLQQSQQHHNPLRRRLMSDMFMYIRAYWKSIVIVLILFLAIICFVVVGEQLKLMLLGILHDNRDISFGGGVMLVLIGAIMVVVGAPILIMELSLGCALKSYFVAVSIASSAKLFGIAVSYVLSLKLFARWISVKFRDNLYLRTLQVIGREKPEKALALLAVIQIPMLLKNYSLPLFNASFKQIVLCFCSIQVVQAMLYCFVGSTFEFDGDQAEGSSNGKGNNARGDGKPNMNDPNDLNKEGNGAWVKDVMAWISYLLTGIVFYLVYRETQKIKREAESMEMVEQISYLPDRESERVHVNMVYPKIDSSQTDNYDGKI